MSAKAAGVGVYRLRITLQDLEPPIWRTVLVPVSITLEELHYVVQVTMGWDNSHLHIFTKGAGQYGVPSP